MSCGNKLSLFVTQTCVFGMPRVVALPPTVLCQQCGAWSFESMKSWLQVLTMWAGPLRHSRLLIRGNRIINISAMHKNYFFSIRHDFQGYVIYHNFLPPSWRSVIIRSSQITYSQSPNIRSLDHILGTSALHLEVVYFSQIVPTASCNGLPFHSRWKATRELENGLKKQRNRAKNRRVVPNCQYLHEFSQLLILWTLSCKPHRLPCAKLGNLHTIHAT